MYKILILTILSGCIYGQGSGDAIEFDGSNDYVTMGNVLNLSSAISIEFWVYLDGLGSRQTLISKGYPNSGEPYYQYHVEIRSDGKVYFPLSLNGTRQYVETSVSLSALQWHHIACVYDGSSIKIFVDGVEKSSTDASGSISTYSSSFYIGAYSGHSSSNVGSLDGQIDEIRIWSDARTLAEINEHLHKELLGSENNLEAYYKGSDGTGTSLTDNSSNSNTGTLTNMDTSTDSDYDCFIGETNGTIKFYENTGSSSSASFAERTSSDNPLNIDVGNQSAPALIDIDNDGDIDCFIGDVDGGISFYINTGTSSSAIFSERTGNDNPLDIDVGTNATPTFVDIDGDGDNECFIGNANGFIKYYENTGTSSSAIFTERTGGNNPLNIDVGTNATPTFIDIDNDGDQDCFIGNANGLIKYFEKSDSSGYVEKSGSNNPLNIDVGSNSAPTFIDIDNDGDHDCFIGEGNGTIKYYENTGNSVSASFVERSGGDNPLNIDVGNMSYLGFSNIDQDNIDAWVTSYAPIGNLNSSFKTSTKGIWKGLGTNESDASNGLTLKVSSALTTGNFAVFGNNNTSSTTQANLDTTGSTIRTARIWQVDESGIVAATIKFDISDATGVSGNSGTASNFELLYRSGTSGVFSSAATGSSISGDVVTFNSISIQDGYYALGAQSDATLPVELTSFELLETRNDGITLQWITESEINNLGFNLDRKTPITDWSQIASYVTHQELQGQGSVSHQTIYTFTDNTVLENDTYDYRLSDVDYDGNVEYHSLQLMGVSSSNIPEQFVLYPNYPNPFNPVTTIRYDLTDDAHVTLTIHDLMGREVITLADGPKTAGSRFIQWNAMDKQGGAVSAGVYLYKIQAGDFVDTKKMILLK